MGWDFRLGGRSFMLLVKLKNGKGPGAKLIHHDFSELDTLKWIL